MHFSVYVRNKLKNTENTWFFGNVTHCLHKGCFACVLLIWYVCYSKKFKTRLVFPYSVLSMLFSVLLSNRHKTTLKIYISVFAFFYVISFSHIRDVVWILAFWYLSVKTPKINVFGVLFNTFFLFVI